MSIVRNGETAPASVVWTTSSLEETIAAGRRLGALLRPGDIVGLVGEYGAGKTSFTRGIAEGIGVKSRRTVTSPSFVIMNRYEGRWPLFHFDCYRLKDAAEFIDAGFYDAVRDGAVVVEWADLLPPELREGFLLISFRVVGATERTLRLEPSTVRHEELLVGLNH